MSRFLPACVLFLLGMLAAFGAEAGLASSEAAPAIISQPPPETAPVRIAELRRGEGPSQAMRRAGCSLDWLAQVLADSGIDPAQVRRLPVGRELRLRHDCRSAAPAETASLSRLILRLDGELGSLPALRRQAADLRTRLAEAEKGLSAARAEAARAAELEAANRRLARENEELQAKLDAAGARAERLATEVAAAQAAARLRFLWLLGAVLLGAAAAGAAWLLTERRRRETMISLPREVKVAFQGAVYHFGLASYELDPASRQETVAFYRCPLCGERRLKAKNVERHLAEAHSDLRMQVEHEVRPAAP